MRKRFDELAASHSAAVAKMNHSEVGFHLRRRFNLLLSFERLENSILWVELKSAGEALNDSFSCTFTVAKKGCVGPLMMMEHYVKIGRLLNCVF